MVFKFEFIGHVGSENQPKQVGENKVLNFTVATNNTYNDKNGKKVEETHWVECELWNHEKLFPHIKKGTQVYIEGFPSAKAYMKKEATEPSASLCCKVDSIQLLGSKKEE